MTVTKPIRVLHVLPSLAVRGGMVNVVENYRKHVDPSEVHFDYLYLYDLPGNCKEDAERSGCRTFYLPTQESSRPFKVAESFFSEHDGEFDILHCHPSYTPQVFGKAAKRHGVKRVIAHSHSTKFSEKKLNDVRNRVLSKFVGFFATDYIACSEDARVLFGRHGKKALILHNAIDTEAFAFDADARQAKRAELGIDDDTLLLGSVGRLSPEKNQAFMLDVLAGLKKKGLKVKLAIAGSGNCEQALRDKGVALGLEDDLKLLGNRSDAPSLYSAFDVFLLTSLFEGEPLSALEAQANGLPSFLSDAITREVGVGKAKFLPLESGGDAWADEIAASPLERMEPAAAKAVIAQASYDIATEAAVLEEFYRQLLGAD